MSEAQALASKVCASCGTGHPSEALFCPHDGTPLQSAAAAQREAEEPDPYLRQEISGHIEIRQLVGIGAMGRVYRAFQRGIDRDVAVKILHRELSANAQLVSRFTREAKVASRLSHPNVVQVLLAGQLPDRALYIVMEFLDGLSLQSALEASSGSMSLERSLHIAFQLCDAVGEAHAQGIVHRDLKPENVMMVKRGSDPDVVKVLDFGIARINWGEQSVSTAAGLIFGTARYISPEGAQGQTVGPASDVYAIATLLYQMLSGRTPFEGEQAVGLLVQQIHDAPPPLASLPRAAYVPDAICEVVMTNLAKDPSRRAEDARAFGHALLEATALAGLSPDDIARPYARRGPRAMKLPSFDRTQKGGSPSSPPGLAAARGESAPLGSTVKWEPPGDFSARVAGDGARSSDVMPAAGRSRAPSGVDATLDDASSPDMLPTPRSAPVATTHVPRTLAETEEPRFPTQYATPTPAFANGHAGLDAPRGSRPPSDAEFGRSSSPSVPSTREVPATGLRSEGGAPTSAMPSRRPESVGSSARAYAFVAACFVCGAGLAAGVAWKLGKLGGDSERDRIVARAEGAMYQNHFGSPAGDNVRELTDDGLRRYPGDKRLLEVRARAASELVTQATQRRAHDAAEALRLARLATELDPQDGATHRLLEQLEAEVAQPGSAAAPPLPSNVTTAGTARVTPPAAGAVAANAVRASISVDPAPKKGQPVTLAARISPAPKSEIVDAAFVVTGGGAPPVRLPAIGKADAYQVAYVFPSSGRFEVVFSAQDGARPVRGSRSVVAADGPAPAPPASSSAAPRATTPPPEVKWL